MKLKIYLRGINEDLVRAWSDEFEGCKDVEVSFGDIFGIAADAIVSPANSFGFMDGGIDLVYSEYFGWDMQKRLQKLIQDEFYGEIPVGQAAILPLNHPRYRFLLSCPTMRVPEVVSNTVNAYLAFRAALIETLKYNRSHEDKIKSILCPGLATLTGRLSPEVCAKQMRRAYDKIITGTRDIPDNLYACILENNDLKEK